ncbi:uncharacterized protein [Elaeis guineensis]|uniref:Testis-expressed protein 10 n=1 Tax=Elaeis guineensis var. tenera TaxID=51953 RepID=A0A6I9RT84_ELAGV|nr:testis-expressed protein 10 [Elaeis guineensis]XP_019707606.1 testis-expressed protein 10 [Elaeis guineensis]XP_019707607.1 testis-expressed protein 10 [Elaeis guineensis]
MVRSKAAPKKPKRGVDFKKIKNKIGRKLPPPRNATNTQIKSKAIVLPEQSVASERVGLAVNKKGLTLRELLQQTSHHNAKIRKAALTGIKDLVLKHPSELRLHKLSIIEKLRERICDNDKGVRETLYQLLKTVIFPSLKEDITGAVISLLMAYIFNAMTYMAVDIRLMAFKFFELLVLNYPSSFMLYAEKVLDYYIDVLRNNQIYLQDKNKLKNALGGLVQCLSLLASKNEKEDRLHEPNRNVVEKKRLHTFEPEICKDDAGISSIDEKLVDLVPILINCFQESATLIRVMPGIDAQSFDCMLCTLQCINLAVKIVVQKIKKPCVSAGLFPPSLSDGPDMMRSSMFVYLKKLWEIFPIVQMHQSAEKEDDRYFTLNVTITEIFLHLSEWINDGTLATEKFLEFIENVLLGQAGTHVLRKKVHVEKHLGSVLPYIPGLVSQVMGSWKTRLLEGFTGAFKNCKVDSKLILAYLSALEEMLFPMENQSLLSFSFSYPDLLSHQIAWVQELPKILLQLGDKHPSLSKVVLKLILKTGQSSLPNSPLALEYDYLQWPLREFYSTRIIAGTIQYGPFTKLPNDCQELALCCLYYFSNLSSDFLKSLMYCCLCDDLEPLILLRIIEVLHLSYKAGHVQISDQIGFLVALVARFKVFPEEICMENEGMVSNRKTFKSLTGAIFTCLSQMGDNSLILNVLCQNIFNEISQKPPLDNIHGLLRMINALDTRPTKLSEENISSLGNCLSSYMVDAASYIPENIDVVVHSDGISIYQYYFQPCIFLFYRSDKLLYYILKFLDSLIIEDNMLLSSCSDVKFASEPLRKAHAVIFILIFMYNDGRLHRNLSSSEATIKHILQNICRLLGSSKFNMTLEERHRIQSLFDHLKIRVCKLHCWDVDNLEKV